MDLIPYRLDESIFDTLARDGAPPELIAQWRANHGGAFTHGKLSVMLSVDVLNLEDANREFGVRRWRHISVSVIGQNAARLADQAAIGRQREAGERSPVPLPDWYDLTHIAYEHAAELRIDPTRAVYQVLPPPGSPYVNLAEALHLRQPL